MPPKPPLTRGLLPPSFSLPPHCTSLLPTTATTTTTLRLPPTPQPTPTRTIKSTFPPLPSRFAYAEKKPALNSTSTAALDRKAHSLPLRTGALALKRGMTALYNADTGVRTACTVLQLDRNEVVAHKTRDVHGYWAVQVGAGYKAPGNVSRALLGHFSGAGVSPKRWVGEFRVKGEEGVRGLGVGEGIGAGWFRVGQWVDVRAESRGMGFAGGMKRHGFGGQPASHGQSLTHRTMGSAGGSQGSGSRVLPGKRMPGNMGAEQVTVKNLKVLQVDEANGLVVVNGCVPGPKNCIVKIQDALGKPWPKIDIPLTDAKVAAEAAA